MMPNRAFYCRRIFAPCFSAPLPSEPFVSPLAFVVGSADSIYFSLSFMDK
jgi:hypothetical protein